jgi:hypothetical protein
MDCLEILMGKLAETLKGATDAIVRGDIYDHGYPEARLIPFNHEKLCQEAIIEEVIEDISEKITEYLVSLF